MLVIISDVHLTDGTSGKTIGSDAFRILRKQLGNLAYAASWRPGKGCKYKPIKELHLVLLGDILDVIRSSKWLEGDVRPWDKPDTNAFKSKVSEITKSILSNNSDSLKVLHSISREDAVTIPASMGKRVSSSVEAEGREAKRVPVRVKIHYQIGNHDWFYGLQEPLYDQLRREIVDRMGLANKPTAPFPYDPSECPALAKAYAEHEVFARHGDLFDPFNFEKDRKASSLGDVIVVELLNRFPAEVEKQLGQDLPWECQEAMREIDNVRPLLLAPVWLDGLLQRTGADEGQAKRVKEIWDSMVDAFLALDFVRERDTWSPWDAVDKLKAALKFSKGVSLSLLSRIVKLLEGMGGGREDLAKNALSEQAFKNKTARFIVYGHTHHHEIVPLDVSYRDGKRFDQLYINTGTWRRVHELAQCRPNDQVFADYNVMTHATFFKADERRGRRFESWAGALDPADY